MGGPQPESRNLDRNNPVKHKVGSVAKYPQKVISIFFSAFVCSFPAHSSESQTLKGQYSKTILITAKKLDSPNGRFSVELDTSSRTRRLFFVCKNGKKTKKTLIAIPESDYDSLFRGVDILWSPDSSYFIMNRWTGSERTVSYCYKVDSLEEPVNINQRMKNTLVQRLGKSNFSSLTFLYVYADRILTSKSVRIRIEGNYPIDRKDLKEDPDKTGIWPGAEFTFLYLWDTKDSFKQLFQGG